LSGFFSRLGLLPLKTDLNSYNLPEECECKGAGCAKCQLKFTLKATGPKIVYAEDLVSADPKIIPVYPKTPIVKLLANQKIELEATAILGKGKEHMKWSPGHIYFKALPIISLTSNSDKSILDKYSKILKLSGSSVKIIDFIKYVPAIEEDLENAGFDIKYSETDFILTIESWGQLPPDKIIERSIYEFDKSLNELNSLL